jgi:dTDP-glucose pyrophosphorylase
MDNYPGSNESGSPFEHLGLDALYALRERISVMTERQTERILNRGNTEVEDPINFAIDDEETRKYIYQRERRIRATQTMEKVEEIRALASEVDAIIIKREAEEGFSL